MSRRQGFGGTMGQDQASPPPLNPPGAPKKNRVDVMAAAAALGVEVKRGRERMWWIKRPGDNWRTYRQTHYLAWLALTHELATGDPNKWG